MIKLKKSPTYRLLRAINGFWGFTKSQITKKAGLTYSGSVKLLNEMEKQELIRPATKEESKNPFNKRNCNIILTPKGVETRDYMNKLIKLLGEE